MPKKVIEWGEEEVKNVEWENPLPFFCNPLPDYVPATINYA